MRLVPWVLLICFAGSAHGATFEGAMRAFDRGRFDESRRILEGLVQQKPKNGLYWFNLGNARLKSGDLPRALEAYRKVSQLGSPLAPAAALYAAKLERARGNLPSATGWVRAALRTKLPPTLTTALREEAISIQEEGMRAGMAHYRSERLAQASSAFELVGQLEGDSQLLSQAAMMRALILMRSEQKDRALVLLERLSTEGNVAPGLRDLARDFSLLERAALVRELPAWLFVDLALGYNSNLAGVASSAGQAILPMGAGAGLRLSKGDPCSVRVGDNLNWEEVIGQSASRYVSNSVWVQWRCQPPQWSFQAMPQMELSFLGADPYLARPSLSLSGLRIEGRDQFGVVASLARVLSTSSDYDYLRGTSWSFKVQWTRQGSGWMAGPHFTFFSESAGSLDLGGDSSVPMGHTGFGPGVSGFWAMGSRFEGDASASYTWRSYAETSRPDGLERSDRMLNLFTRLSYRATPRFAPYLDLDLTVNASTLDSTAVEDRNFTRFIVMTGLSWDLL